ncbi:alpha/beta hydrolase [Rhizobium sullae]|uniref:Putative membrane protein n=1 Tax=Rhizobium sullae TaxID=50338 RepID=A0A4R3QHN1_RHISU|nr:putative membrane protein [Rhizobium sullae]
MALLFFAGSLTPSMIPRTDLIQGVLSGLATALGYGIGLSVAATWTFLQLPAAKVRTARVIATAAVLACAVAALAALWKMPDWQNSVRLLMELEAVETGSRLRTALVAALVFLMLVLLGRLFTFCFVRVSTTFKRFVPVRISYVIGAIVATTLFWFAAEGILFRVALRVMDSSFQELDARMEDDIPRPTQPGKTGSPPSEVSWDDLGRQGRRFVSSGPTEAMIRDFFYGETLEPIRVYVGMNSAETAEERAELALRELKRTGAFERSILIIVAPTGTGMVDPAALDTVEYLHRGDVASVAVQYSYLASWLSLLVEPNYGSETAVALFRAVYNYWITLPRDGRPKLYLHGLSLGAMNSELSADLYDIIADPFQGALWSGPPFPSRTWRSVTNGRDPRTPEWLPRFRGGSVFRFTNQKNSLDIPGAVWGPMRIVYLQYASDPITFFDTATLYREPDWLRPPRGPDVSTEIAWYPVVTMLQLAVDMAIATTSPMGYGHVFAPEHYIDGWVAVTDPPNVTADDISRLKTFFANRPTGRGTE